jgi:hypothetical protein
MQLSGYGGNGVSTDSVQGGRENKFEKTYPTGSLRGAAENAGIFERCPASRFCVRRGDDIFFQENKYFGDAKRHSFDVPSPLRSGGRND